MRRASIAALAMALFTSPATATPSASPMPSPPDAGAEIAPGSRLRFDLFVRPVLVPQKARVVRAVARPQPPPPPPPFVHDLKATLVTSTGGMANVDGVLVQIGETFDGHRLETVLERQAVFVRGTTRKILTLN